MVGGTRASSVGDGVGAIEIGLALGLIDATEDVRNAAAMSSAGVVRSWIAA